MIISASCRKHNFLCHFLLLAM